MAIMLVTIWAPANNHHQCHLKFKHLKTKSMNYYKKTVGEIRYFYFVTALLTYEVSLTYEDNKVSDATYDPDATLPEGTSSSTIEEFIEACSNGGLALEIPFVGSEPIHR